MQAEFVAEVIESLDEVHIVLDTSGYGSVKKFRLLVTLADLVLYDLKLIDAIAHQHYTGCDNAPILKNLHTLSEMGKPFIIRVPLVPGVTDTDQNLRDIALLASHLDSLQRVELLPYNKVAGSKYSSVGMTFMPDYDETQELNLNLTPFEQAGIKVSIA